MSKGIYSECNRPTVASRYSTAETGGHLHSVGGFSVHQPPRMVGLRRCDVMIDQEILYIYHHIIIYIISYH